MGKLGKPTPLEEAEKVAFEACRQISTQNDAVIDVMVCGSVRRRRPVVNDVDLLVVVPSITTLPNLKWGPEWHVTPRMAKATIDDVLVEAWWCPVQSLGPMLQFLTGPASLNVYLRGLALERGWKLSQYYLQTDEGMLFDLPEQEVFHRLGVPDLLPEERDHWRGDIPF